MTFAWRNLLFFPLNGGLSRVIAGYGGLSRARHNKPSDKQQTQQQATDPATSNRPSNKQQTQQQATSNKPQAKSKEGAHLSVRRLLVSPTSASQNRACRGPRRCTPASQNRACRGPRGFVPIPQGGTTNASLMSVPSSQFPVLSFRFSVPSRLAGSGFRPSTGSGQAVRRSKRSLSHFCVVEPIFTHTLQRRPRRLKPLFCHSPTHRAEARCFDQRDQKVVP